MLAFTATMPNQVMAFWIFDQDSRPKSPTVLASSKVDTTKEQAVEDQPVKLKTSSIKPKIDRTPIKELVEKRTASSTTYLKQRRYEDCEVFDQSEKL